MGPFDVLYAVLMLLSLAVGGARLATAPKPPEPVPVVTPADPAEMVPLDDLLAK